MRIVPTPMAPISAPVRKDILEKEGHAKVQLQWFSRPCPVFLFSYGCHHTHRYTIFAGLKYRHGYFTSCLIFFPSPEGTRIKEGNEKDFFSYYMINNRKGIYHSTIIRNIFLEHAAMLG